MSPAIFRFCLVGWIFVSASGAAGGSALTPAETLERLREADHRVAAVAFRLVTKNVELCSRRTAATGLVLHDASQYRPALRPAVREAFSLGEGLGVSSVIADSPASRAGLRENDQLLAINGYSIIGAAGGSMTRAASHGPFGAKLALLEREFEKGAAMVKVQRGDDLLDIGVTPVAGCASRFQLLPGNRRDAWADGQYVSLTSALLEFVRNDDELAVILSHELSHNLLEHRSRLKKAGLPGGMLRALGANARRVKETEIEADRLGLRLMHVAGYRIAAAESFWRRFAAGAGLLAAPTHPSTRRRLEIVRDTIVELNGQQR